MLSRLLNRPRKVEFQVMPVRNDKDCAVMVFDHPGYPQSSAFHVALSEGTLNSCGFWLGQYYRVSNRPIPGGEKLVLVDSKMGSYYRNPRLRQSRSMFLCTTALTGLFGRFPKRIYFKEVPHEQA